jgi:glycosyltransferase involved in cell wall biosynthesis
MPWPRRRWSGVSLRLGRSEQSDPRFDTADFADSAPGNLRADYVPPSVDTATAEVSYGRTSGEPAERLWRTPGLNEMVRRDAIAARPGARWSVEVVRVIGTLEPGGAQLSALRLSRALQQYGIVTRCLLAGEATQAGLELARRHGIRSYFFSQPDGLQWRPSTEFAAWLADWVADADLVHAHMFGAWWAAAQVVPPEVPLVASEHNVMSWPRGDYSAAAAEAVGRVDAFFAHGPAAREFAQSIGVPPERLLAGRSALDGLDAVPLPGLARPRLTFTGRFREDKAPDVLVEALALLPDAPTAYLLGDGPIRQRLQARIASLGLTSRVVLPGWVYEPARYVAGSSVHVVPSREEAWSQSAVVALGLGVPVVGTDVEGLTATLGEGRGVLVPPEDPPALATALRRVLAGEHPSPEPGLAYASRFTPDLVAGPYARAYLDLAARATGRRQQQPSGRQPGSEPGVPARF